MSVRGSGVLSVLTVLLAPTLVLASELSLCGSGNPDWVTLCSTEHKEGEPVISFFQGTMALDGNCLYLVTKNGDSPAYQWVDSFCLWNPEVLGTVPLFGFTMAQEVPGTLAAIKGRIGSTGGECPGPLPGTNTASVSVQCFPVWSGAIPITPPYSRKVTSSNLAESMRPLKYTTNVATKLRVFARMNYWTQIKDKVDHQPVRMLYGWAEGSSGLLPGEFKFGTDNGIFTMTVMYDLEPGTYIFVFEETAWTFPFTAYTAALKEMLPPPTDLGEYEFSGVLPPGPVLESTPDNHTMGDPRPIPYPVASFDTLHFRVSAPQDLQSAVSIKQVGFVLTNVNEKGLGGIEKARLHLDPSCKGETGDQLAPEVYPFSGPKATKFQLSSPLPLQPGENLCFTVVLEPNPEIFNLMCPCEMLNAMIGPDLVEVVDADGNPVQVQGELVKSYAAMPLPILSPTGDMILDWKNIQSFPLHMEEIPLQILPENYVLADQTKFAECVADWGVELSVGKKPDGAGMQGLSNQKGEPLSEHLTVPFTLAQGSKWPTASSWFRIGNRPGQYVVEATLSPPIHCAKDPPYPKVKFTVDADPAPIVVNSSESNYASSTDIDPNDRVCFTGNWTPAGDPECSLAAAIQEANARPGEDTITFSKDAQIIKLKTWQSPLLNCPATLDGAIGFDDRVWISGGGLETGADGLGLFGKGCRIVNAIVRQFPGIGIKGSHDVTLDNVLVFQNGLNGIRMGGSITARNVIVDENGFDASPADIQLGYHHGIDSVSGNIVLEGGTVIGNAGLAVVQETAPQAGMGSWLTGVVVQNNKRGGTLFKEPVTLTNCSVEGNQEGDGIEAPRVTMTGTRVMNNGNWGVDVHGGAFQALGAAIVGNHGGGVRLFPPDDGSAVTGETLVSSSIIASNVGHGVEYLGGPLASIHQSTIVDNGEYGVFNGSEADWVDARWNWWGAVDGPAGVGPGKGDEVSERVLTEFFAKEKMAIQVVPESEPVQVVPGVPKDVAIFLLDPNQQSGTVTLSHDDQKGWIQGPKSVEVKLSGGIGTAVLPVLAPADAAGVNPVPLNAVPGGGSSKPGAGTLVLSVTDEADVAVEMSQEYAVVVPGGDLGWTVTVKNLGPSWAANVQLTLALDGADAALVASGPDGACGMAGPSVACHLGGLGPAAEVVVGVSAKAPATEGKVTLKAEAWASTQDPDKSNNSTSLDTTVTTVLPKPAAKATPESLGCGTVGLGGWTAPRLVRVTNEGTGPLLVSGVALKGADAGAFLVRKDGCSGGKLLPGKICDLTVAFIPSAQGDRTATLTVASNDPDTPSLQVALKGRGAVPPEVPELLSPADGATVTSGNVEVTFVPGAGAPAGTQTVVMACADETFAGCDEEPVVARGPSGARPLPGVLLASLLLVAFLPRSARRTLVSLVVAAGVSLTCGGGNSQGGLDVANAADVLPADVPPDAFVEPGPDAGSLPDATSPEVRSHTFQNLKPGKYSWKVVERRPDGATFESAVRTFVVPSD